MAPRTWVAIAYYRPDFDRLRLSALLPHSGPAGAGNLLLVTLLIPPVAILLGAWVTGRNAVPSAYAGFGFLALGLLILDGRLGHVARKYPRRVIDRSARATVTHASRERSEDEQMLYDSASRVAAAPPQKRIMLFGMSGLGKTHISNLLRADGGWFHYSVDYRIGTRYMGEHIADNFKREAMKVPLLRELLMIGFGVISAPTSPSTTSPHCRPISASPATRRRAACRGTEYLHRQEQHRDGRNGRHAGHRAFHPRARKNFTATTISSATPPGRSARSLIPTIRPIRCCRPWRTHLLMVWIEGSDAHTQELIRRFDRAPKPMCYQPGVSGRLPGQSYLAEKSVAADKVDPDDFVRWTYARALPTASRAIARWRKTGASRSPPTILRKSHAKTT